MTANITTGRRRHEKYCHEYHLSGGQEGDVRRCRHGRLQVVKCRRDGWSGTYYRWTDVFSPITYYRASRALREEQE